jgi:glycosyltransferase involved in cell wall biosynthesis
MSGNGDAAAPRVTVVTPAYNVAQYLGEAVDSVLAQTFTDFEYLVVDDGSQDNSVEVVRAHAGHDPRFRLIPGEHRGLSAVRNIGIRESRGQYIAYLDGDDRWHPQFLERQVALLESLPPDVGLVFCRPRLILENGTVVFYQWQRAGRYDFDDFLVGANPARCGSSLLIRKSCFDDVGNFDEDLASVEDLEMWLRIAAGSKTPVLWGSKHFLVDLRLRPGSVTRDRTASDNAIRKLLEEQTGQLRRLPASLAYVRPAVTAYKYGDGDDLADEFAAKARSAGARQLVRSVPGLRLLFWNSLSPARRQAVRSAQDSTRELVKSANLRIRGGIGSQRGARDGGNG